MVSVSLRRPWMFLSLYRQEQTKPLLIALQLLPISDCITYKLSCMCYNSIIASNPQYLADLLQIYTPSRTLRSTADTRKRKISLFQKKFSGQRSFSYQGPVTWNNLPFSIRHTQTCSSFKSQLKPHLFSQTFQKKLSFYAYDYYEALCIWFAIKRCVHGPCIAALHVLIALIILGCVHVWQRFAVSVGLSGVCMFYVLIVMLILVLNCELLWASLVGLGAIWVLRIVMMMMMMIIIINLRQKRRSLL